MSEETVKVHIVKVERSYEFTTEAFDIKGFFNYQKALDFIFDLAKEMDVHVPCDESEFEVDSTPEERNEFELLSSYYYIDDVEVEK